MVGIGVGDGTVWIYVYRDLLQTHKSGWFFLSVADTAFSKRVVMVNSRYWEPKGTLCSHYE